MSRTGNGEAHDAYTLTIAAAGRIAHQVRCDTPGCTYRALAATGDEAEALVVAHITPEAEGRVRAA